MTKPTQRERGQVLVLFALAIFGIVALLGLVVDGGFLYVQRRTAQTAADAGALAGARALREASSTTVIANAAINTAHANAFGITPTVLCAYLVGLDGVTPLGMLNVPPAGANCPAVASATSINNASGVHVDAQITYPSIIAGMLRVSSFTAAGQATAQLGTPSGISTNNAPLIICAGGTNGAASRITTTPALSQLNIDNGPGATTYTSVTTYNVNSNNLTLEKILDTSNNVIAGLAGHVYYLKGPLIGQVSQGTVSNDCAAPSNTFDGGSVPGQTVTLPGQLSGSHGNSVPAIGAQVEAPGGCASGAQPDNWIAGSPGCVMFLPLATSYVGTDSNNRPVFSIPAAAEFYVWCNKSSQNGNGCQEYVGQLVPGGAVTGKFLTSVSITNNAAPTGAIAVHLTL